MTNAKTNVDGRTGSGVSRAIVHQFGRLDAKGTAPAGVQPPYEGLTEPLGGSAVTNRTQVRSDDRRLIALEYLQRVADDLSRATIQRIQYIANARRHGATWRDIATALDLTETGARTLYERNRDRVAERGGDA